MKIYKILIPKDFQNFDKFCDSLSKIGKYSLNSQHIILLAEKDNAEIIRNNYQLEVTEVLDCGKEIESVSIKKWIIQELFNNEQEIIKKEMQERINAMHNVLKEANEIIEKGELNEIGNTSKEKDTD